MGGEGSGDRPGHEFHGNQYGYGKSPDRSGIPPTKFKSVASYGKLQEEGYKGHTGQWEDAKDKWLDTDSRANPMTDEEEYAVHKAYAGNVHAWDLNRYLRREEYDALVHDPEKMKITINNIKNAINKQPTIPKGEILWRGVQDRNAEEGKMLEVGDIVADKGFTSTTYDLDHAQNFCDLSKYDVIYRIVTSGKEKAIPGKESETEMIFQAGQKWEVVGIEEKTVLYLDPDTGKGIDSETGQRPNRFRVITVTGID